LKNSSYLCIVKGLLLTTPLSAGSKALSILLQLKATLKGGFYFSYSIPLEMIGWLSKSFLTRWANDLISISVSIQFAKVTLSSQSTKAFA